MNIKHPELLFLILLIPAMVFFLYYSWKRRSKALGLLCRPDKIQSLFPGASSAKTIIRYSLLCLAVMMFVTSLISPRWGYDWKEIETKGTNIIIALDVSTSMLAEDISPNRLARAKYEIDKLLQKLTGDRVGLIIFAGDAFLQSPLTHDYMMVRDWVAGISTDSVETPGTSIKSAVEVATKAFQHIKSESKALIIMSDGEEHDEETLALVSKAHAEGINIYTIGIGTAKGAPIQLPQGLVHDTDGSIVISKLDDSFLKKIAETGGGHYVRSSSGDFHLDQLYYDHIKADLGTEVVKSGRTQQWYETYQLFMSIGLIALLLEILLSIDMGVYDRLRLWFISKKGNIFSSSRLETRSLKNKKRSTVSAPLILLLAVSCQMLTASAQANIFDPRLWIADSKLQSEKYGEARSDYLKLQVNEPHNSRLNYNLGVANYREGAYEQAVSSFGRAAQEASSSRLKEKALYDLGNAYFKLEEYKEAIASYEDALKIDPNDEDAKYNLELAKKKLADQDKNKDGQDKKDNKDNKNNKDKDKNKDDKQDKDNKNKPDNKPDQQEQPKPQADQENSLDKDDIDRLLRQAQEAKPGEVNQGQPHKANTKNLKPW